MVQLLLPCLVLALPTSATMASVREHLDLRQDPIVVSDPSPSDLVPPAQLKTPATTEPSPDSSRIEAPASAESPERADSSTETQVDPRGCWSGSWMSCKSGHQGVLRATLTACGDQAYRAEFRGRFFKIMPFRYTVTLQVVGVDEHGIHLAGSQSLGRLFGTFHYQATITDCRFEATYRSCKDWGKFSLGR